MDLGPRRILRTLLTQPVTTAVAVVSIAVGIGANVALFGWAWELVYQERTTPRADELLWVAVVEPGDAGPIILPPPTEAMSLLRGGAAWDAIGAWDASIVPVEIGGTERRLWVRWTTPGFLAAEGVRAGAGRLLEPADTLPTAEAVALVAHGNAVAWWGSASAAVGRTIRLDRVVHRVVGVIEPEWDPAGFPVHIPLSGSEDRGRSRVRMWVHLPATGRAAKDRAAAEVRGRLSALRTASGATVGVRVGSEKEVLRAGFGVDWGIFVLPVAVLLVACVNVSSVLLAQGSAGVAGLATRRLLGGSTWRIAAPLLLRCAALAVMAGILAILLAAVVFRVLPSTVVGGASALDVPSLGVALGLVALVVLLTGVWPAHAATQVQASELIRSSHPAPRIAGDRLRGVLLAIQSGIALVVVLFASEAVGQAIRDGRRGVGYDPEGLFHAEIDLASGEAGPHRARATDAVLAEDPRVQAAGVLALRSIEASGELWVDGRPVSVPRLRSTTAPRVAWVTHGLLGALGLSVLAGRDFTDEEVRTGHPVALVNQAAAALLSPRTGDALGVQVRIGAESPTLRVLGVVQDMRDQPLFQDAAPPVIYTPMPMSIAGGRSARLYARATGPSVEAMERLRAAITQAAPVDLTDVRSTEEEVRTATSAPRIRATVTTLAGGFALLLVSLGLYGVTSLVVTQQRRDLAVRAAMGAGPTMVVRTAAATVLAPVGIGVVAGLMLRWILVALLPPGLASLGVGAPLALLLGVVAFGCAIAGAVARPLLRAALSSPAVSLHELG